MERVLLASPYDWGTDIRLTPIDEECDEECIWCQRQLTATGHAVMIGDETTSWRMFASTRHICLRCVQDVEHAIRSFNPDAQLDDDESVVIAKDTHLRFRDAPDVSVDDENCVVCDGAVQSLATVLEVGRGRHSAYVHWVCHEEFCDALADLWDGDEAALLAAAL